MNVYRDLFAAAGVPRLAAAAAVSRLTTSMLSVALLLAVIGGHGSYGGAGAVLTGQALSLAVAAPVTGRLADTYRPRPVLLGCLGGQALAYAGLLAAIASKGSIVQIALAAAAVGGSTPPAAPVTRSQWRLLVGGDMLGSAYAFDSALNSVTFVAGPLLAGGLAALAGPYTPVAVAGSAKILGDLLLATAPSLSRAPARPLRARPWRLGALSDARVRVLLSIAALDTFTYGSLLVGAAALTMGRSSASLLIAMFALGEVAGGLGYGLRRWPAAPRIQLITLHLVSAFVLVTVGVVPALPALACLYLTAGIASGSRDTLNQVMLGAAAPPGNQTESFAWLATFMWAGYGAGTATAGQAQAYFPTPAVFLLAAMAAAVAAVAAAAALPATGEVKVGDRYGRASGEVQQ